MLILAQNRTGLWGVSLAVVLLLTSACIAERALPLIEVIQTMPTPSDPGPADVAFADIVAAAGPVG